MAKRSRDITVSFGSIDDSGYVPVYWQNKVYAWFQGNNICSVKQFTDERLYECSIVHNFEHRAMINFTEVETGTIVLRQEVNRYEVRDVEEWLVDE